MFNKKKNVEAQIILPVDKQKFISIQDLIAQDFLGYLKSKTKIIVFSPHLDDSVLSMGSLLNYLSKNKINVEIINIFTKGLVSKSKSLKTILERANFKDIELYFEERKKEDKLALKEIGIKNIKNLDYIDAAWRVDTNNLPIYPDNQQAMISFEDSKLVVELREVFRKLLLDNGKLAVFVPLGRGKHVDHQIVRNVVSKLFSQTIFYQDFPYSAFYENEKKFIVNNSLSYLEWKGDYSAKKEAILKYLTQKVSLFYRGPMLLPFERYYFKNSLFSGHEAQIQSPKIDLYDSRLLRQAGLVEGKRPEVRLLRKNINIVIPTIAKLPKKPLDVVLIFGLGPVTPTLSGRAHHRKVILGKSRMRHNTLAGLELTANGYVKENGLIITSGTATADPLLVEELVRQRKEYSEEIAQLKKRISTNSKTLLELKKAPYTLDELEAVYQTTEADLMMNFFEKSSSKSGIIGKNLKVEKFIDGRATETLDNFIFALNELDKRSRKLNNKLFTGSIAAITSRYHSVRVMETAHFLGIDNNTVPLVSQTALIYFGYGNKEGKIYDRENEEYDESRRWKEQKWIRALYQLPEYLFPRLFAIEDDERLISILVNIRKIYGDKMFQNFITQDLKVNSISEIRKKINKIKRKIPLEEEWMKSDTYEINQTIESYDRFTYDWLSLNK